MKDWSKADWVEPGFHWTPLPIPELPPRVLIDFATKCNLRCPMCTVWGSGNDSAIDSVKGVMEIEKARKLLDELADASPDSDTRLQRAVVAEEMRQERALVLERLRAAGAQVLDADVGELGRGLVQRYLQIKRRELL